MVTARDTRIIDRLLNISRQLDNGMRQKHVSGLFRGKRLISLAHNQPISDAHHYRWSKNPLRAFRHAETACIKQAQYRDDLSECTLYVARAELNGAVGLSRPCNSCLECIQAANIPRIVYTIKGGLREEWM